MILYAATSNPGKLQDYRAASGDVEVLPLPGVESMPAPEETGTSFAENAAIKATAYSRAAPGRLVIADDSGLEVAALGGAPGIRSARYAQHGDGPATDAANNDKLLHELSGRRGAERAARFVCVIAAARDGELLGIFRGEAAGEILDAPRGTGGFGYDPLFYVAAAQQTFAEMGGEVKWRYSHRGAAFRKLREWLEHARRH
jgi:XTP/dITP diphosphohydrolase